MSLNSMLSTGLASLRETHINRPVKREDLGAWVAFCESREQACRDLVMPLQARRGIRVHREESKEVGAIPFILSCQCEGVEGHKRHWAVPPGPVCTIRFRLLDHNSDSDVVITNMTVKPAGGRRGGFGTGVLEAVIEWAAAVGFKEIRASQISNEDSRRFWVKNGFIRAENPNPCNDHVRCL